MQLPDTVSRIQITCKSTRLEHLKEIIAIRRTEASGKYILLYQFLINAPIVLIIILTIGYLKEDRFFILILPSIGWATQVSYLLLLWIVIASLLSLIRYIIDQLLDVLEVLTSSEENFYSINLGEFIEHHIKTPTGKSIHKSIWEDAKYIRDTKKYLILAFSGSFYCLQKIDLTEKQQQAIIESMPAYEKKKKISFGEFLRKNPVRLAVTCNIIFWTPVIWFFLF